MQRREAFGNGILVVVSLAAALLLCEVGAHLVLNPANYLSVQTIPDPALGMMIAPNSAGFDAWGFRNRSVPDAVDIVALGDSHTFGNTATMEEAWPSVLQRRSSLTVYNLGLGGYGPNQYFELLRTKGLKLQPKWVICGLYMGDDFENAFSITYGLDYWSRLRTQRFENVNPNIWDVSESRGWSKGARDWLSQHSLIYRLVVHGPVLGRFKEEVQFRQASRSEDPVTTALDLPDRHVREAFRPIGIANRLDQQSAQVREGMRITFELLREMQRACAAQGCRFAVVIIPTKETVFGPYFEQRPDLHLIGPIKQIIADERAARAELVKVLDLAGIPYVDTLPALRASAESQLYARTTRDMHPSGNGYRVIGESVATFVKQASARQ